MFSGDKSGKNNVSALINRWRSSDYFWYTILIFITLICFRSFINPGIVWKDDFVPRHPAYAWFSLFIWNPLEHGGALNDDLSNALLNSVRAYLSGVLGVEIVSKIYVLLVVGLPGVLMFRALSLFRRNYFESDDNLGSFLGALFFMINPWVTSRILSGHFFLISSYALTPVYLYYLYDYFKGNRSSFKYCFGYSVLISMTSNHGVVMTGFATAVFFAWCFLESRDTVMVKRVVVVYGVQLLASMFWVLPTVYLLFQDIRLFPEISNLSYSLSTNANWFNVVRLFGYFWSPYDKDLYALSSLAPVWILLTFLMPLLALISLQTVWKRRDFMVCFVFIYIVSIVLGQGTQLIGENYLWFVNLPFLQLFRDPNKLLYLSSLSASFLIGLSFSDLTDSIAPTFEENYSISVPRSKAAITVLIVLAVFTVNFPWTTGDFNGLYGPVEIPDYHDGADEWLSSQSGDFRVLYLPVQEFVSYNWSSTSLNEPARYLSGIPVLNPPSTPAYDVSPYTTIYLQTVQNILFQNKTQKIGAFLGLSNIQYVVLRMDTEPAFLPQTVYKNLIHQTDLELVWAEGSILIFENLEFRNNIVYKPVSEVIVPEGFTGTDQLAYSEVSLADKALIYPEQNDVYGSEYPLFISSTNIMDVIFSVFAENSSIPLDGFVKESVWVWDTWFQTTTGQLNTNGMGLRSIDSSPLVLRVPVEERGDYVFALKMHGAVPRVTLNNVDVTGDLEFSATDDFFWVTLNKALGSMQHEIEFVPTGAIVIDRVHIISSDLYSEKMGELDSYLSEHPYLYVIEAEEFDGKHSGQHFGGQFSNREALNLDSWDELSTELPFGIGSSESFILKIRGSSTRDDSLLTVKLTNLDDGLATSYIMKLGSELGTSSYHGINLGEGRIRVTLTGPNMLIDCVTLLPERAESTFYADTVNDIGYTTPMPTSFTIPEGEATGGTVVFVSSYTSGWVLSQGRVTSEPMRVNFVSMGFPLDYSGLKAEIKFVPQLFMNVGYFVSITTLITFIYLLCRNNKLYEQLT